MSAVNATPPSFRGNDLLGRKFGSMTVIGFVCGGKKPIWLCECACGTRKNSLGDLLRRGEITSCGCQRAIRGANLSRTHGKSKTPAYRVWLSMIARCTIPSATGSHDYLGRGISVCERWRHSFENFFADMGNAPSKNHSLDRFPNNDGNYEPSNCRWATRKEQNRNKRSNKLIEIDGVTKCLVEWAEIANHPSIHARMTISLRIKKGWPPKDAVFTPIRKQVPYGSRKKDGK